MMLQQTRAADGNVGVPKYLVRHEVERRLSCITDRDVCGARSHIEHRIRADDFQRDGGVFFTPFRQLRDQPFAGECARARHAQRRLPSSSANDAIAVASASKPLRKAG